MTPKPRTLKSVEKATAAAILSEQENKLARKAYELRQAGCSWFAISESLQISEARAGQLVKMTISEAAKLVSDGARQELLTLEVERLDAMQESLWPTAISGDTRAIETVLKIIAQRSKMLGLDQADTAASVIANTVVIGGTTSEYIAALRAVAEPRVIDGEVLEA